MAKNQNLLLIFTRNPQAGKVKKRLAATIGDQSALEIYTFLLNHTAAITKNLPVDKEVYYSEEIVKEDIWDNAVFQKKLQKGEDLGERMENAFQHGFDSGYKNIIIIGSDIYDLNEKDLENAFLTLEKSPVVIGPAKDGGYYLLGMKTLHPAIFKGKTWGASSVLRETLAHLEEETVAILESRNDIDTYHDIKDNSVFNQFLVN